MRNVSGGVGAEGLRRGVGATLRTCGRPFSILINANNELFSVWLGADPPRRGQPPPDPAYDCTNDRFHPSFPVPQSRTVPCPRDIQRQQPIASALSRPTDRQSSCRFDSDEGRGIDFDGTLVPLFFSYIVLFRCPGFPQFPLFHPSRTATAISHSLSFYLYVTNS